MANQNDIAAFFKNLPAFIALAQLAGIHITSSGVEIAKIGADVAALAQGGQPTAALAAEAVALLKDLHADGVIQGSVMDQAIKVGAVVANYLSGQVAVLDAHFTELGKPGKVFAIADDSDTEAASAFRIAIGEKEPPPSSG